MTALEVRRARGLVDTLKNAGENHGLLIVQNTVVLRNGVHPSDAPTMNDVDDLKNAIALGLLQENQVSGTHSWTWYVLKERLLDSIIGLALSAPHVEERILAACRDKLAEPGADCVHLFLGGDDEIIVEKNETVRSLKEKLKSYQSATIQKHD